MSLSIVFICLALVVWIYFYNNPLKHGSWFLSRRFINWFPLGMTYAFLYMGRYNLTVAKNALGSLMSNEDFGLIFAAGTITYAFSVLINGPLVDKIGRKTGILIAALGAASSRITAGNGGRFFSCHSRSSAAWLPGASGTNFPPRRAFTLRPSSESIWFSRQLMETLNT